MTRPAEEPRQPKRPRPPSESHPAIDEDSAKSSTFRPNPNRTDNQNEDVLPGRAGPRKPTGDGKPRNGTKREPMPQSGGPNWVERIVFGRVGTGHLATFCRQFGAYLDAGVPILRALDGLQSQFAKTALGPVLERVGQSVRQGDTLSEAMKRESGAFDTQFIAMISVAEARGGVPEVMKRMATGYESKRTLIRQARSALIYPTIMLLTAFGIGLVLTIFVLPKMVSFLEDGLVGKPVELPLITKILLRFNQFMITVGWFVLPLGLVGSIVGLFWLYRRPRGKALMDQIALYIPVLGKLLRMIDTARFGRVLSTLLEAGVDVVESLDLTAETMMLDPFRRAIHQTRAAVMDGSEIAPALRDTRLFSDDTLAIVNAGEETGKLPEGLDRMAADYEERVEVMVKSLGSLIQPLIIVIGGGIVLFIVLAFMLVYVQMITGG